MHHTRTTAKEIHESHIDTSATSHLSDYICHIAMSGTSKERLLRHLFVSCPSDCAFWVTLLSYNVELARVRLQENGWGWRGWMSAHARFTAVI